MDFDDLKSQTDDKIGYIVIKDEYDPGDAQDHVNNHSTIKLRRI